MTRNATFLLYFGCLLLAIVYSRKDQPLRQVHPYPYSSVTGTDSLHSIPASANSGTYTQQAFEEPNTVHFDNSNTENPFDNLIELPDAATTQGYTPTAIKNFQAADPAEGVSLISVPVANSSGNAVLTFTMKLPEGRGGLQPNLDIQYNNEGGSSWLGTGWNILSPSIGIETRWGSPRYDPTVETEMYTMNGEQLAPVNNRSEWVARSTEKQFYPRVQNNFSKIIRHGDNPRNYWWEVTSKNGVHNYFGGKPGTGVIEGSVLTDDLGNIAYWALVESRDAGNNYVRYLYDKVEDAGVAGGTVTGTQLYLGNIFYTGYGSSDGPYRIDFTRDRTLNETKRKDISIDARFGFKMVTADLLRRVDIYFNNAPVRSYTFDYAEGAFYKTLLKSISELDAGGQLFYSQQFNYYDDVQQQDYTPSAGVTTWTVPFDDIKGDLENPVEGFTAGGSVISTSKADSRSGGAVVTVGSVTGGTWSKNSTVGGGFNYSLDYQEGLLSLIDINGDGLPDKVYKKGTNLYYRPNLGAVLHAFGDEKPITGALVFNSSETENIGGGAQVIPPSGFLGYNVTRSINTSKIYFSDFNGDGLMDIASVGKVLFNRLNAQGDPDFVTNSALTPSPVFAGTIDTAFLKKDTALQSQQERDYPLQDVIRMWEAPATGTITISAPIQLVDVPAAGEINTKKDGVRASIQLGAVVLDTLLIGAGDYSVKNFTIGSRTIQKGQRIYFRLQSRYNGEDDLVNWDPVIRYTSPVIAQSDRPRKASNYYRASEDFIYHSKGTIGAGKNGMMIFDGTFKKEVTSDSLTLLITRVRNGVTSIIFEQPYAGNEQYNDNLAVPSQVPVVDSDEFHFLIVSRSYIDRSALEWRPHYAYVSFDDGTAVTNANGDPSVQGFPVPDNSNFNHWMYSAAPVTVSQKDTVTLWPLVTGNGQASGSLWFTVKGTDTVYARRRIFVNAGTMNTAIDSIRLVRQTGEPLFMEYATDSMEFAVNLQQPRVRVYADSVFIDSNAVAHDTTVLKGTLPANLYTNPGQDYLGPLFRGWGHFALKGDKGNGAIDETQLNLNEVSNYPTDPNNYTDSASIGGLPNPAKTNFILLFPDQGRQLWVGYDTSVYVTGSQQSSSRLWVHDVTVDTLMAGEAAGAAYKVNTTMIHSFSAGVSPGVTASGGTSFATTIVNLDMIDMNGDRYPDVLNDERIQYTLPTGGLGSAVIPQPIGETTSEGSSYGFSLGGNFLEATAKNNTQTGAVSAQKTAKATAGLSGSVNFNDDESQSSWYDINGDGLVDRVYKSGIVQLNLGYRFAAGEQWGLDGIDKSTSVAAGAGIGINIDAGSIEAGIGLSRTAATNTFLLNDVNGDGLPDQTYLDGSQVWVRLNTGSGFGDVVNWKAFDTITNNISTGESINGAFTISIPIFFIKIAINPSVSVGHGVSRQERAIMDIDGDGYADLLTSRNDGDLTASSSTIGRTNMLSKVTGPLGGYFSLDYERVGNTYEMPQSKWVMKSVEVYDGTPGDGVDTMRRRFIYEGGYQDRHEREFYGFHRVISQDLNTAHNNSVYRSLVQEFLNTSFYNKGLPASEWMQDSAGHKYTQTNNQYEPVPLQDYVQFPALVRTNRLFYEGGTAVGAGTKREYAYDEWGNVILIRDQGDGSERDSTVTLITYHDLNAAYIKNIPSGITVSNALGIIRKRSTSINQKGDITRVRQYLADGTFADTDMEYDVYGMMTKITRPPNHRNERMWYSYEYDNITHQYLTKVTDAFGYSNSNTYDYRFGALTETTSINNERVQYTLDNRGRLITLTGPKELAAGKAYTIAFSYNLDDTIKNAITRHYDPEHDSAILLINFTDGLGRNVQTKKQVSLFSGKDAPDNIRMVVSGTTAFDAFGRVETTYYPITEPVGPLLRTLNGGSGLLESVISFDVADRVRKTTLADGAVTKTDYTVANGLFSTYITDALNNNTEYKYDVRDRQRFLVEYGPDGAVTTRYDYNCVNELTQVTDNNGNALVNTYDNLGRKLSMQHPDAGLTTCTYDLAGNLRTKITDRIRKEMPNGGAIQYQYEYERLTDIDYPRNYQNKVKYTYGQAGTGSKAGRLVLQQDATGGQEFFYGSQGEIIKVIRTVLVNPVYAVTYVSEQEYDTWNRIKKMTYADGETVTYHYNRSGGLYSMDGIKQGSTYRYVDQLGYDEFEQRIYLRYGNGAETEYRYDSLRRRLSHLQALTPAGRRIMNHSFTYDQVSNLISSVNDVQKETGKPGGYAQYQYHYDGLYRLDSASAEYRGEKTLFYGNRTSYDNLYNITHKTTNVAGTDISYDIAYLYGNAPHLPSQVGASPLTYDDNGNQHEYAEVENFWDEENRLTAVLNKGVLGQYTYDAAGERVVRSSGGMQGMWLNGAAAGLVRHNDNYSIYVNPFLVCNRSGFTKHYYIENQRIASKLGHGNFTNISFPQTGLSAGNVDYVQRAAQIENNQASFYASQGVSPGPPTDKNFWARPENSGIPAPVFVDSSASSVPRGWPGNTTPPPNGPPIFVSPPPSNDSVKAGYGFSDAGHFYENDRYFYHPDNMGNTNYVTNALGEVSMHMEYSPFGETFVEEYTSSYKTAYLSRGKGRDDESGYYFFRPRYYEPASSLWLSVDVAELTSDITTGRMGLIGNDLAGNGYAFSAGNSSVSDIVFGDAGAGINFSSYGKDDDDGSGKNDKSKPASGKQDAAKKEAPVRNKPANARSQAQQGNMPKRAFRQQRNAGQYNGMFFNHNLQTNKSNGKPLFLADTRPRANAVVRRNRR